MGRALFCVVVKNGKNHAKNYSFRKTGFSSVNVNYADSIVRHVSGDAFCRGDQEVLYDYKR